ncbi:hypothetical protein BC827DRAFT_1204044 [Russula dissimulans]|nr:hypothetical protein BC827DRAFT_1204044 [Russula dissimulans]
MAPAIPCQKTRHIVPRSTPSPPPLLSSPLSITRRSHYWTSRRISLAHKRRLRYRQFPDSLRPTTVSAPVSSNSPPLSIPIVEPHPSVSPSTYAPVIPTIASHPTRTESAPSQLQAARNQVTAVTAVLIAVCVLVGLAACSMMGSLVYRKRSSLLRRLRPHHQAEADLRFVFIEYDESTWGTPSKAAWKEMPSFETCTEDGEVHTKLVTDGPLTPVVEISFISAIPPLSAETLPGTFRSKSSQILAGAESGSRNEPEADGQDPGDAIPTETFDPCSRACCLDPHKTEVSNALGLAMEHDDDIELGVLASPQLAAALALRAAEVDDAIDETDSIIVDSAASDSAECGLSTESSGSEEDFELQRAQTHSLDFGRGFVVSLGALPDIDSDEDQKSPLDIYNLPRVVISASPSVTSDVFTSRSNRASGKSETTIDLGDFPRPPFIGDTLTSISTSLLSEIEVSLGQVISGSLGMTRRRTSSAPQLMYFE